MGAILIPAETFRRRRERLARRIGDGALILSAAPVKTASRDLQHPYVPDKYLYYLTGFAESDGALLMTIQRGEIVRELLLCRPRNPKQEQWEGERLGSLRARRRLQIAESGDIADFQLRLRETLSNCEVVYYLPGASASLDSQLCTIAATRRLQNRGSVGALRGLFDVSIYLDDMRAVKDADETALIRRAAKISSDGHRAAMKAAVKANNECRIEAPLVAVFRAADSTHAFPPIIAAGKNALTLHYTQNNGRVHARDMVLVDAGAEYGYYAGDVSRTFPAGGKFSPAQAAVYDIVLSAQKRALSAVRAGVKWNNIETIAVRAICRGLAALNICRGSAKTIESKKHYRRFYMHRIGHLIGLDVHDVGRVDTLRTGMTLTIEPGLYIPADSDIPPEYHNIGVRIEDTVLVRAGGCEVLSDAPKTRAEVEAWMRG